MKLSNDYKKLFAELQPSFKNHIASTRYAEKKYTLFFPMVGPLFEMGSDLMVVGRACNGWIEGWDCLERESDEVTGRSISVSEDKPMQWVLDRWSSDYAQSHPDDTCNIKRSSFWRAIRKLALRTNQCDERDWALHLVWSNVMKISPYQSGNPNNTEWYAQLDLCKELFRRELAELKPKHVLLITAESWGADFVSSLGVEHEQTKGTHVAAIADHGSSRIILTGRPEGKDSGAFVEEILLHWR